MAPAPPSWRPLLLEFPPDPDDAAVPQAPASTDPKETPHAVQDDQPRIDPGILPGAARTVSQQKEAAFGREPVRVLPENPPRNLDRATSPREPGQRAEPDRERSSGV